MSAIATTRPRTRVSDRLLTAAPLASIYLWLSIVYCVEAWKRKTPWLFTDELEFTQLSRSIAATGHAARRGEPHSIRSLYILLVSPFWLIDDVAAAFAAIKYFDVLVMASVLFPTYFLARLVVGRAPALFAAAAAAAIPALTYSSWIVEETLAYPYATLCLFLFAKTFLIRSRGWIAGSLVAALVAPFVRGELIVIPIALALGVLFMWWSSDRARARRADWTYGDWVGFLAIVSGVIILISGIASHHSKQWLMNTAYNWTKHRIFTYGDWAAGAVAVGIGVVPFILGLAALVRAPGERRTQELRVFRSVATAGIVVFGLYTAMKAAYLSQVFESRVEERNLIYIAPLLFIGTAVVLERRRVNFWALGAAAAYVLYVILGTPLFVGGGLYSDAPGLSIFQQANRYWYLNAGQARWILAGVFVAGLLATVILTRVRAHAGVLIGAGLAAVVLAWNVAGQIAAAAGNVTVSRDVAPALSEPFTWVDDATHLHPTLYLGQAVVDPNAENLLEFWNRSITTVSSLDGSITGPGPSGAPNITAGGQIYWTLSPSDPGKIFDYAVEDWPCIDFAGTRVARHFYRGGATLPRQWRLIQLTKPNRLRAVCVGVYPDGWSTPNDSRYFRFRGKRPGWLRVSLGRPGLPATAVDLELTSVRSEHRQPVIGRVQRRVRVHVPAGATVVTWFRTPASTFAVQAVVRNKVAPHDVDPRSGDVRKLGAQVSYRWSLTKGK